MPKHSPFGCVFLVVYSEKFLAKAYNLDKDSISIFGSVLELRATDKLSDMFV